MRTLAIGYIGAQGYKTRVQRTCRYPLLPYLLQDIVIVFFEGQTIGIQFHIHHRHGDPEHDLGPAAGSDDGHDGRHQNATKGLHHLVVVLVDCIGESIKDKDKSKIKDKDKNKSRVDGCDSRTKM